VTIFIYDDFVPEAYLHLGGQQAEEVVKPGYVQGGQVALSSPDLGLGLGLGSGSGLWLGLGLGLGLGLRI
jgi:hypothetical protein